MALEWSVMILASGAAVALNAQLPMPEKLGFECAKSGLSVHAQIEPMSRIEPPIQQLELFIAHQKVELDPIFMLETEPHFWAGTITHELSTLSALKNARAIEVHVPGQVVLADIDQQKVEEF